MKMVTRFIGLLLVMLMSAAAVSAQEGSSAPPVVLPGDVIVLQGQVVDTASQPIIGAIVQIWQADPTGAYYDEATANPTFQYFGTATTDADGYYAFLTLMPDGAEGTPALIHVQIKLNDMTILTTQFYLEASDDELGFPFVVPASVNDSDDHTYLVFTQDMVIDTGSIGTLAPTLGINELLHYPPVDFADYDNDLTSTADDDKVVVPILAPSAIELNGRVLYRIVPELSQVSFALQEDLRGVRTNVVGTTNQVAGDFIIDFDEPFFSQLGTIRINARTLQTDNENRNRALRAQILLSAQDQYEFIDFVPTFLNNIPAFVEIGQTYTFSITGNLTIIGVSREVTFDATAVLVAANQVAGTATTTVRYADWGIRIPNVPGVSNVTDDVVLTLNFLANQVEG